MGISEAFDVYYGQELARLVLMPERVTASYQVRACLKSAGEKEIYLLEPRGAGEQAVLRRLPSARHEVNAAEYRLLKSLNHLQIPRAIDLIEEDGFSYLIRGYAPGVSLAQWVKARGASSEREAARVTLNLCDLVSYLHSRKPPVIHRDIKPENVILSSDGTVRLIDFDIARQFDPAAATDTTFMGTIATAPPEQYGYAQTDARSDVYALGILLIYLLTGRFERSALFDLPPNLKKIAAAATEFSPQDRYPSAASLKRALRAAGRVFPRRIAAAAFALAVAGGAFCAGVMVRGGAAPPANAPRYAVSSVDEAVSFKDAGIEALVREALGMEPGEAVTHEDLYFVTELYAVGGLHGRYDPFLSYVGRQAYQGATPVARGDIRSLEDLKEMPNLKSLTLVYQKIKDLSPLKGLALRDLTLNGNFVRDLSPLQGMAALTRLEIEYTPVSDIAPLAGMTRLQMLNLHKTNVSDLSPLKESQSLSYLNVSAAPCADYSVLYSLPKLTEVSMSGAAVEDVVRMSEKPGLKTLIANDCGLTSLGELAPMPDLETLVVCGVQVSDLSDIGRFPMLRDLELSNDAIHDLSPLKTLKHLERLDLRNAGNGLDLRPLLGIPTLKTLVLTSGMRAQTEEIKGEATFEMVFEDA